MIRELERQQAIRRQLSSMPDAPLRAGAAVLSTGFACLDRALGIGGLPAGRIVEIFGPPSAGKSALALQIIAHRQRSGGAAAWIDADHTFDAGFAAQLGVDVSALPVAVPGSTEEALQMARRFAASSAVDLVALDSVAALVPELEHETGIGQTGHALPGRVLGRELRPLAVAAARSGVCILLLNQTRARQAGAGAGETSSGGPALKLHAAVRIVLAASGRRVRLRVLKNKLAAPFTVAELEWLPGSGLTAPR